jgi:uncharacterized protein (DUF58 family)
MANPFNFDSAFLQKLERLALLSRHPLPGPAAGPRRSPRRGASVEFADFRDYTPGDDFRRIDWKAYGRLDRLFLRLYSAEEMTALTLFLDHSASMRFGEPSKALFTARLAAILSYIALHNYDLVALAGWGDRLDRYYPPRGGKAATSEVWDRIAVLMDSPQGPTDFSALRGFQHVRRGAGVGVVISDLLSDSDWRGGLRALRAAGQEVTLIQVLAPEELNPSIRGDWKLHDVETAHEVEITVSPRLLKRYAEELAAHTADVQEYCRQQGIAFLQIPSNASVADTVLAELHAGGVLG